jgi:predicted transposase YdaD
MKMDVDYQEPSTEEIRLLVCETWELLLWDEISRQKAAWIKGYAEGIAKGYAEVRGIAEGTEEYRTECIEKGKIELARNLLACGYYLDIVSNMVDLPQRKIKELRGEMTSRDAAHAERFKKGLAECIRRNKLEMAKTMLQCKLSIEEISKISGIPTDEIENEV